MFIKNKQILIKIIILITGVFWFFNTACSSIEEGSENKSIVVDNTSQKITTDQSEITGNSQVTSEEFSLVSSDKIKKEASLNEAKKTGDKGSVNEPIIINGDQVEYSTDNKNVTVIGNAEVIFKGTRLTCEKITVDTSTKDAVAEGNVRLDDKKGIIEGSKIIYNFETKTGTIIDSEFRSNPYFGKANKVEKVSDTLFTAYKGHMTTCNYDIPHYRFKSSKINIFPDDKVETKNSTVYVGKIPVFFLPQYNHSLKDPMMHVQVTPGKRKEWGNYLFTAWRYDLNEDIKGRIYLDYREKLGVSEGLGLNYKSENFGKGDYKYYYTQERSRNFKEGEPAEFERYLIRWRHKWDIDEKTDLTSEYYKITDSKRALYGSEHNFLKDYFYREYEKDSQPLSYTLIHRTLDYSSIDLFLQKRTNRWYTQLEKLPEITYSLPGLEVGETPLYFENNSSFANFNYKHAVPSPSTEDISLSRFNTYNKFSLPMKASIFSFTPWVGNQETFYDKDINGSAILPRTIFYTGSDISTKFYRIFNIKSNFLGLDINNIRHIITPTVGYSYNHQPTIDSGKLKQIDSIDSISRNNSASLELSNKLQTKRNNMRVDLLDFRITSSYIFKPKYSSRKGSSFSDFNFDLELLPYSWLRLDTDATYNHYDDYFSNVNTDIKFILGEERSIGFGQRYQRKAGKEFTFDNEWRLTPKWKFRVYERYQFSQSPGYIRGLREQEYSISRDLHCWIMEFNYNVTRGNGEALWLIFRLKAFPELEFNYNQDYHRPKPGSQS